MELRDPGLLQAYLDGELTPVRRRAVTDALSEDPELVALVEELRATDAIVGEALATLEDPTSEAGFGAGQRAARAVVQARIAHAGRTSRTPWLRAAVLVLLFGSAAAAAVPGSPIRTWIERSMEDRVAPAALTVEGADADAVEQPEIEAAPAGVRVRVDRAVRVVVRGVRPTGEIQVLFVAGAVATVMAGENATYRTAPGLVEVTDAGSPVRIELPRAAGDVTVEVEGSVFLRKRGAAVELPGPLEDSTAAEVVFRVPASGGGE